MGMADVEAGAKRRADEARKDVEGSLRNLQSGERFEVGGESVPKRPLVAIGLFVVAFVAAYALTWAIFGGIGLALGFLTGLAAGWFATKLYADRAPAEPPRRQA